jgi:hypothetical protein
MKLSNNNRGDTVEEEEEEEPTPGVGLVSIPYIRG